MASRQNNPKRDDYINWPNSVNQNVFLLVSLRMQTTGHMNLLTFKAKLIGRDVCQCHELEA